MAGVDLLNVGAHPKATFRTTELREISHTAEAVTYAATGMLSLAGKNHVTTIPLDLTRNPDQIVVRLTTSVAKTGWAAAFDHSSGGVFDQSLQLQARLVFPTVARP